METEAYREGGVEVGVSQFSCCCSSRVHVPVYSVHTCACVCGVCVHVWGAGGRVGVPGPVSPSSLLKDLCPIGKFMLSFDQSLFSFIS